MCNVALYSMQIVVTHWCQYIYTVSSLVSMTHYAGITHIIPCLWALFIKNTFSFGILIKQTQIVYQ